MIDKYENNKLIEQYRSYQNDLFFYEQFYEKWNSNDEMTNANKKCIKRYFR